MNGRSRKLLVVGVLGGVALGATLIRAPDVRSDAMEPDALATPVASAPGETFQVTIRSPGSTPRIDTGVLDRGGQAVTVACSACHTTTSPRRDTRSAEQLDEFHQGLRYTHGTLSCLSCHNETNYEALRLADGTSVAFGDVMTLCGQCHGPQLRDYRLGLHGGMTGYWDLSRGPRTRNNCIHCHDPHAPAFPLVQPVFQPRDRLAIPPAASSGPTGEH